MTVDNFVLNENVHQLGLQMIIVQLTRNFATDGAEDAKDFIQKNGEKLGDKVEVREVYFTLRDEIAWLVVRVALVYP